MATIKEFREFVKHTLFPESYSSLSKCNTPEKITKWKEDVKRRLDSRQVVGEHQPPVLLNPQDIESSHDMTLPQKVYFQLIEIVGGQKEKTRKLQQERDLLQSQIESFKSWNENLTGISEINSSHHCASLVDLLETNLAKRDKLLSETPQRLSKLEKDLMKVISENNFSKKLTLRESPHLLESTR